jgi:hypothetical protein
VLLRFLVHCDRPFVGAVYEVILALVRNAREGSRPDPRRADVFRSSTTR